MTRIEPKYAWSNKGAALFSQGKYDEAIKCYDEAIRLDPKLAETWCNKGAALTNLGYYDEAIKACDEAIRLDPKSAIAWDVKGIAIWNQGNSADAINAFNEAVRLDPKIPSSGTTRALFSKLLDGPPKRMLAFAKAEEELQGYSE